jgi:GIY-YIG catalytic domain
MLQWYDRHTPASASEPDGLNTLLARALPILTDPSNARTKKELAATATSLKAPGLYSWWVDDAGAADLSTGLGHLVRAGLIYAGQAGATHEQSGKPSAATLASRLLGQHFNGSTRGSTFRWTLGFVLTPNPRSARYRSRDLSMDERSPSRCSVACGCGIAPQHRAVCTECDRPAAEFGRGSTQLPAHGADSTAQDLWPRQVALMSPSGSPAASGRTDRQDEQGLVA